METNTLSDERVGKQRKAYRRPQLTQLGDLRNLTLGGSPGPGESGHTGRKVKLGLPMHLGVPVPGDPGVPTPPSVPPPGY